jgi:hypothetical protein
MVSEEVKKFMFENCPKIWEQFVNNELSEDRLIIHYEIKKRLHKQENLNRELKQQLFDALERNIYLNKLQDVLTDSVELEFKDVRDKRIFLN